MKKIEKRKVEIDFVEDIICDICGKSCLDKGKINFEFSKLEAKWGFYSNKDTEHWECDICEECSNKIREYVESLGGKIRRSCYGYFE